MANLKILWLNFIINLMPLKFRFSAKVDTVYFSYTHFTSYVQRVKYSKWLICRVPCLTSTCQVQMHVAIPVMSGNQIQRNYQWCARCQLLITLTDRRIHVKRPTINRIDPSRMHKLQHKAIFWKCLLSQLASNTIVLIEIWKRIDNKREKLWNVLRLSLYA